jgi:hypothetical protein
MRTLFILIAIASVAAPVGAQEVHGAGCDPTGLVPHNGKPAISTEGPLHFAIVTDLTGVGDGENGMPRRERIFKRAIDQINVANPEFVVSVGDLIQGPGKKDLRPIAEQWSEFNGWVKEFNARFYYVVGNHDIGSLDEQAEWCRQHGARYYNFVYKNVLFLFLDSEDPPPTHIGPEQAEFVEKALADHPKVDWTLVFFHKPFWSYMAPAAPDPGWDRVKAALEGRKHTVFAGHVHRYVHYVIDGTEYYTLATTGANHDLTKGTSDGQLDHFAWVTMTPEGPRVLNVLLDDLPEATGPTE